MVGFLLLFDYYEGLFVLLFDVLICGGFDVWVCCVGLLVGVWVWGCWSYLGLIVWVG